MAEYVTKGSTIAAKTNGGEVDTAHFVGGLGKRYYIYNPSGSEYLFATYGNTLPADPSPENYIVVEPGYFSDLGKIPRTGMGNDIYIKLISDGSDTLWEAAQGISPNGDPGAGGSGQKGDDGKDGVDGLPGTDGKDGVDGKDGTGADIPHDHDEYLVGDGPNDATDAFRIRSGDKTFVSLSGDELGLYHVKAPTSPTHVARLQDVTDADYAPTSHSHANYSSTTHGHSYASSNHSHSYAASGHTHDSYAIKGSSKKIMQDDGSTGPVQFTVSGNNLYWSK